MSCQACKGKGFMHTWNGVEPCPCGSANAASICKGCGNTGTNIVGRPCSCPAGQSTPTPSHIVIKPRGFMFSINEARTLIKAGYSIQYHPDKGDNIAVEVKHRSWSTWVPAPPLDAESLIRYLQKLAGSVDLGQQRVGHS